MTRWPSRWGLALVLLAGLLSPRAVQAGPYFGEWSWCWHPESDCPHGTYCPLHYWTPTFYRVRACVHPVSRDQYPPGESVPPTYLFTGYPCRSTLPSPAPPYANPESFYGFPLVQPTPPPASTSEKKNPEEAKDVIEKKDSKESNTPKEKKETGEGRYPAEKKESGTR